MAGNTECDSISDAELIYLLAEDTDYLKCVSLKTRKYCIRFMLKQCNGIDPEYLTDIYHDALLVLYEKAKSGQLKLTCSIQTYLNSICRNQLLNRFKSDNRVISLPAHGSDEYDIYHPEIKDWLPSGDTDINNERVAAIAKSLEIMKGKGDCYELLMMVHYHNRSMKQIAAHFDYRNEQIAKNKNYLCREKLKSLTFQELRKKR